MNVTANTEINVAITAKKFGSLVVIEFQSGWMPWNANEIITIGWTHDTPVAYVSREAVFGDGNAVKCENAFVLVDNTAINVRTPSTWENGRYAHIFGTLAFLV